MKPTPSCRDLVEGMTPLLAGFDRMWEHFSKKEAMRHVSFAAPIDLCRLYFSELVAKWADAHPGITFDIRPEATADDVRNGLVDVAVINYVPLDATGLVLRRYNSSRPPPPCDARVHPRARRALLTRGPRAAHGTAA